MNHESPHPDLVKGPSYGPIAPSPERSKRNVNFQKPRLFRGAFSTMLRRWFSWVIPGLDAGINGCASRRCGVLAGRGVSALGRTLGVAWMVALMSIPVSAADYYVSPSGNDLATCPGTLAEPFRTITYASRRVVAGDTVHIRAGTYREVVRPQSSGTADAPITFKPYENEKVVITTLEPIVPADGQTWKVHKGNIHKIQLTSANGFATPSTGQNAVFCDGRFVGEARWPNVSDPMDFRRESLAAADSGSVDLAAGPDANGRYTGTFNDADLASFSNGAWTGAAMRCSLSKNWWQTATTITSSPSGSLVFKYAYDPAKFSWDIPGNGDPYFLIGRLVALDAQNEAFFDDAGVDGPQYTLYMWKPGGGSPAASAVEMRKRNYCIEIGNRSWLKFERLNLLAGGISTNSTAFSCSFDRFSIEYGFTSWARSGGPALWLDGTDHRITNSDLSYSTGAGLSLKGSGHVVENCVIRDCANAGIVVVRVSTSPQVIPSTAMRVEGNTVFNAGDSVVHIGAAASRFLSNHVYNGGLFITDVGLMNAHNSGDVQGSEVAWNWVHDNRAIHDPARSWNGGVGIRYDSGLCDFGCSNYSVHHNIVWNAPRGAISLWALLPSQVNSGNAKIKAYNNTCADQIHISSNGSAAGIDVRNNIAIRFKNYNPDMIGATLTSNLLIESPFAGNLDGSPGFVSAINRNYQLIQGSRAVDSGVRIPPFTDGFSGAEPDMGALERGKKPFVAGAMVLESDVSGMTVRYEPTVEGKARFVVSGLPVGRSLPLTTRLRIGTTTASNTFAHRYDFTSHVAEAVFTGIDTSTLSGSQMVRIALDGSTYTRLANVNVAPVPVASGSLSGIAGYYAPVDISGDIPTDMLQGAIPVFVDTASLIAAGKMRSDGGDIVFLSEDGSRLLSHWVEASGLGTSRTLVWVMLPPGTDPGFGFDKGSRIWMGYGSPTRTSTSNMGVIMPEFKLGSFKLWLKGDSLSNLRNGTAVARWPDSSGAGNHATQTVAALRPTLRHGGINAFPIVSFDGLLNKDTGDFMGIGNGLGEAPFHFLCVYRNPSPGTATWQRLISAALDPNVDYVGGAALSVDYDSAGVAIANDTARIKDISFDGVRDLRGLVIGRFNKSAMHWFRGEIAEVIGFTQKLTTTQRERVLRYLGRKYAQVPVGVGTANLNARLVVAPPPTNLTGTVNSLSSVALAWTKSPDGFPVAGYRVYRNGTLRGTTATPSYTDTGLSGSVEYRYTVTAFDSIGNVSPSSAPFMVKTSAPVLAPIGSRSAPAGQPLRITVQATDADGSKLQYSATGNQ